VILVVAAGLFWWNQLSTRQSERFASQALGSARLGFESKNYALAASELSRIIANYPGTGAAAEATLLLAQVRLAQGQSQSAIEVLRKFAPEAGRDYQAQAYGLLGAAYENVGHPKDAAEAYEAAARSARMSFLKAQYLSDAGRAWLAAGDTAKALGAYQTIVTKYDSSSTALEAKVRIGEITKGIGPVSSPK
jgi:TolA-binding protein